MNEIVEIMTTRNNPDIDPYLNVWKWEIPAYLFLGGLVAGILILSGLFYLMKKDEDTVFTSRISPIFAPLFLGLGMFALFLDLSHKLYVWRFYTTFQWTSPMSWGSWILIVVFPVSILFGLQQLPENSRRWLHNLLAKIPKGTDSLNGLLNLAGKLEKYKRHLAITNIVMGIFLGIYTGILLSNFVARPFWNTSLLGFLFLASGLSAASAFNLLFAKQSDEKQSLIKLDLAFLVLELVILTSILISWFGSNEFSKSAGSLIIGGPFTAGFWGLVVLFGMLLPIILEYLELKGRVHLKVTTPLIVLMGGLFLRIFFVYIGQYSHISLF